MEIKNAKRWGIAGPKPYYVGFVGYIMAFALRYILYPVLDDNMPILFFAINSLFIAYYYGFVPSFVMLLLSFPTSFYFFVKPYYSFGPVDIHDIYRLTVYTIMTGLAALMIELLRREQYKSILLARVSDSRYRLLVEADEDRRAVIKKHQPPQFLG
ncbi:MAG: DUF4118 domain-containing protein [Nitrosomonadales bacterium]